MTIARDLGRFPVEIQSRGSDRWELRFRNPVLQWLVGSIDLLDRRVPVMARDYDELLALYTIEAEERAKHNEDMRLQHENR